MERTKFEDELFDVMSQIEPIKIGATYKHFKGGLYEVLMLALHSESSEEVVIYKDLKNGKTYVRPLTMWSEIVTDDKGHFVIRFTKV